MIIEFSIGNYRSVKEIQTLSMEAANLVSKFKEIDIQNVHSINDKWSLLKSKAIYGANASGKSNLISGLKAFINIVNLSVKDDGILNSEVENFLLDDEYDDKPTFFQLMFLVDDVFYRYGFEATNEKIVSEWLFGTPGKKEVPFFVRETTGIEINDKQFSEASKLKQLVRDNSLFLTVVKSLNGKIAEKIIEFISRIVVVSGLSDRRLFAHAGAFLDNNDQKEKMVAMLKIADVGIEDVVRVDIEEEDVPDIGSSRKRSFIVTTHKRLEGKNRDKVDAPLSFDAHESEGSKKMFELSPIILSAIENCYPLILDEFDARFHPLLSRKLVEFFNSESNTKKTQFVFATHDTNLLDASLLRRDQICFAEKDKDGASHFYTLAEFKGVRNDASFEKDYIRGKYGAIPFIGDFNTIFESHA